VKVYRSPSLKEATIFINPFIGADLCIDGCWVKIAWDVYSVFVYTNGEYVGHIYDGVVHNVKYYELYINPKTGKMALKVVV